MVHIGLYFTVNMLECSNILVFKCLNIQIFWCSNAQLFKYSNGPYICMCDQLYNSLRSALNLRDVMREVINSLHPNKEEMHFLQE